MKIIEVSANISNKDCLDGKIGRVTGIVTFSEDGYCKSIQCTSSSLGKSENDKVKAKRMLRNMGEAALKDML